MTLLLSISPAAKLIVGIVVVFPAVNVIEPWALRKPLTVAVTVYIPAGALRLNVPSVLAVTDMTSVFVASYKLTVTGLLASTCPVSAPVVGTGVAVGVAVNVDVGDAVGVGDSTVVVAVGVAIGSASRVYVATICS